MLSVRDKSLESIRKLVIQHLQNIPANVYLIGSNARGDTLSHSDIDIAIELLESAPSTLIVDIRVALEESDIPFFVDIFDYSKLNEQYRQQIKREGILWHPAEE